MNGIILYLPSNNYYSFHGGQNGENVATTVGAKKPFLHKTRSQFTVQPKKFSNFPLHLQDVDRGASKPES